MGLNLGIIATAPHDVGSYEFPTREHLTDIALQMLVSAFPDAIHTMSLAVTRREREVRLDVRLAAYGKEFIGRGHAAWQLYGTLASAIFQSCACDGLVLTAYTAP